MKDCYDGLLNWNNLISKMMLHGWDMNCLSLEARSNGTADCATNNVNSLVWQLWEETHVPKVVGSNPCTVKLDGHFSRMFVVKIVMFVWKDENKQKETGDSLFKNIVPLHRTIITLFVEY